MDEKRIVGIYVRVSTNSQVEEGYSIGEQTDKLKKYCEVKDWAVFKVYTDGGFSGSNIKRPGIETLINDVKSGTINTVLVYKLDRLSRSQKDTLYLIEDVFNKNNCAFISLNENFDTSTAFGKAMVGILSVFAQLEREQITQRMQMGRVGRAKAGYFNGSQVPMGYDYKDGKLIINEVDAQTVKMIYKRYDDGLSLTGLLKQLNAEGHIGRELPWNFHSLRYLLANQTYTGKVGFSAKWYPGLQKPIIDQETFDFTQAELKRRQITTAKLNNLPRPFQAKYMLSGLLKCGICGYGFSIQISKRNKDKSISNRWYRCRSTIGKKFEVMPRSATRCIADKYKLPELEKRVLASIRRLSFNDDKIDRLLAKGGHYIEDPAPIKKEITRINLEIEKLLDLYTVGSIPLEVINTRSHKLQEDKQKLEDKLTIISSERAQKDVQKVKSILKQAPEIIDNGTYEEKKMMVHSLVSKIVLVHDKMTIYWAFS